MDKEFSGKRVEKLFYLLGIAYEILLQKYFGEIGVKIKIPKAVRRWDMGIYIYEDTWFEIYIIKKVSDIPYRLN